MRSMSADYMRSEDCGVKVNAEGNVGSTAVEVLDEAGPAEPVADDLPRDAGPGRDPGDGLPRGPEARDRLDDPGRGSSRTILSAPAGPALWITE